MSSIWPSGSRLLLLFLVIAIMGGFSGTSQQAQTVPPGSVSVERRIQSIRAEARRIDAADDASDNGEWHHRSIDLPHWQFTGLFNNENPVLLNAIFTEGQLVREESYYLIHEKPLLVKIFRWWDVDEKTKPPEPAIHQDFYIEGSQTIRRVISTDSSPKTHRTIDNPEPATAFGERASLIAKILRDSSDKEKLMERLQPFPEAELSKK